MDPNLIGIFRVGKQDHLEQLLDGKLRFTPIEAYKKVKEDEAHRNDSMEGLKRVSQDAGIHKGWIRIEGTGIEIRPLIKVHVAGALPNVSVLSFTRIAKGDIPDLAPGRFDEHKTDPRMMAFGNAALIVRDLQQFIDRFFAKAKEKGLKPDNGSVEYLDGDRHEGPIRRIGFTKLKDPFHYQKEYRLALTFKEKEIKVFVLDIGSISDIAEIIPLFKPKQ